MIGGWERIKETCAACCCQPRRGVSAVKRKRRYRLVGRRRRRREWEDVYESVIASIVAGSLSRATDFALDISVATIYKATLSLDTLRARRLTRITNLSFSFNNPAERVTRKGETSHRENIVRHNEANNFSTAINYNITRHYVLALSTRKR